MGKVEVEVTTASSATPSSSVPDSSLEAYIQYHKREIVFVREREHAKMNKKFSSETDALEGSCLEACFPVKNIRNAYIWRVGEKNVRGV